MRFRAKSYKLPDGVFRTRKAGDLMASANQLFDNRLADEAARASDEYPHFDLL
jgi:hypothetical protein